jgi:hypothetical protein
MAGTAGRCGERVDVEKIVEFIAGGKRFLLPDLTHSIGAIPSSCCASHVFALLSWRTLPVIRPEPIVFADSRWFEFHPDIG